MYAPGPPEPESTTIVASVPGPQRVFVVSDTAAEQGLLRLRDDLGRRPVVLAAPTDAAARVSRTLEAAPGTEPLLAPVTSPPADRGHRLDELVRRHALQDRYRDVVVVADAATSTLLLRALAPDQLASDGPVTVVGLPRGARPVAVRRGVAVGVAVGLVAGLTQLPAAILVLPALVACVGLALLLVGSWRHLGQELLLTAAVTQAVVIAVVASSARFPGAW